MNFSIVIPVYNEDQNLLTLTQEILKSLSTNEYNFEIIFVNDCSTDNTGIILKKIYSNNSNVIKIINNKKNQGQSISMINGIKKSIYNTIITLDGDLQNDPKDISNLVSVYFKNKDVDLVGGIRFNRKDSLIKKISSKIANNFRKMILNDDCIDTGCSLKIFNKRIFLLFPEFNGIHRFLPALFKGYGKKTLFINVNHRARIYGKSNYGTFIRLFAGIRDIFRVKKIIRKFKNAND